MIYVYALFRRTILGLKWKLRSKLLGEKYAHPKIMEQPKYCAGYQYIICFV